MNWLRSKAVLWILASTLINVATVCSASQRPNILWVISEDNSVHYLKLYRQGGAETPAVEAMAQHGLVFDHAFSTAPVCSVARTALITSCYGPRIFTQFHRRQVAVPLPDGVRMFPAYLRDAGYYTTNNSKTDYNVLLDKNAWDESSASASWRNRKPGQPFFHKQTFTTTHESSLHFDAAAMAAHGTTVDRRSVLLPPYHPDTEIFRYTHARYRDQVTKVDGEIGRIIAELTADGLLEDTFIFYFADHGGVLPRGKGYAYESGLHIPLVVRVPAKWKHLVDRPLGSHVVGFVSHVDLGATVQRLAGAQTPNGIDGLPFLGAGVSASEVDARDETFGYADRFDEKYDLVRTLRKGKFKYIRSFQPFNFDGLHNNYRYNMLAYQEWRALNSSGNLNSMQQSFFLPREPEMLFDVEADPHETINLAHDSEYTAVLTDLRNRLRQRLKGMPDLSFYPESFLVDSAADNPVAFGQEHKQEIARLIDIADLQLLSFENAQPNLERALGASDPWHRYWGLIVLSRFGKSGSPFFERAKQLAASDENLLVRTRAAEFLGLSAVQAPQAVIADCLSKSQSGVEAGLILNSVVLLRDGKPGYAFEISANDFSPAVLSNEAVTRRLDYLTNRPAATSQKKKRQSQRKQ